MLLELIQSICRSPQMYTRKGTYNEVCAWISGYTSGMNDEAMSSEWGSFVEWVPKKLHYPSNYAWPYIIWETYPDDAIAIEQLSLLYAEFNKKYIARQKRLLRK